DDTPTLVLRGSLDRESLHLAVVRLPDSAARLGWLAQHLDQLPGSGIVYTLTVAAAVETAAFLTERGHDLRAYTGQTDPQDRAPAPRRTCWPTAPRPWSPPAPWAWASTSPTSASWCTWAHRSPRSPTTSRSAGPDAACPAPRRSCCPARRTGRSGGTSPASPSP